MNVAIVVPTIRENSIQGFLAAWEEEFRDHPIIVVEDNPERSFQINTGPTSRYALTHVSWKEIDADLKDDAWIIPRRSAGIRNYGNLLASRLKGLDMIVNLDDDCLPDAPNFLGIHWAFLEGNGHRLPLFDTMESLGFGGVPPRGYPKQIPEARTMLNHGLWNGVPDIDGETQLATGLCDVRFDPQSRQVPPGVLFPMSAMNIAFRPELLPAMYNLPMGQGQPFNRFDDIWCGLIMKKACDAMGWAVRSGSPCIRHIRASDAKRNAELEAPGIVENEKVWDLLAHDNFGWDRRDGTPAIGACLMTIHAALMELGQYWKNAFVASNIWRSLLRGDK